MVFLVCKLDLCNFLAGKVWDSLHWSNWNVLWVDRCTLHHAETENEKNVQLCMSLVAVYIQ